MFISPELFQFRSDDTPDLNAPSFYMDEDSQKSLRNGSVLGKRSRTEEHNHFISRKTRTALTIKFSERDSHEASFQSLPTPPFDRETFVVNQDAEPVGVPQPLQRHATYPLSKYRRRIATPKKSKVPSPKDSTYPPVTDTTKAPILLTPCHICHKAPRLKKDLEGYAGCGRCEERTCYICIRRCEAGGCERNICRQCCVEQGENGDVYCLECLERTRDHEMEG